MSVLTPTNGSLQSLQVTVEHDSGVLRVFQVYPQMRRDLVTGTARSPRGPCDGNMPSPYPTTIRAFSSRVRPFPNSLNFACSVRILPPCTLKASFARFSLLP